MGWKPRTPAGRFLRGLLFGTQDWQRQAHLYDEICPHLALLPPRHRYSCVKKIQRRLWGDPLVVLVFLLYVAMPAVGLYLCWDRLPRRLLEFFFDSWPGFGIWFYLIPQMLQVGVGFSIRWAAPKLMPNRLRRIVRDCVNDYSDLQVCTECGYDLRGQTVPRCPECGTNPAGTPDEAPRNPG